MRTVGMQAQQEELCRAICARGIAQASGAQRDVGTRAVGSLRALSRLRRRSGPRGSDSHQDAREADQGTQTPSTKEAPAEEHSAPSSSCVGAAENQAQAQTCEDEDLRSVRGGV